MSPRKIPTFILPGLVLLGAGACQVETQEEMLRGYTTNTTLDDGGSEGPFCEDLDAEDFDVNSRRSLFETNPEALAGFNMEVVLSAVATNSNLLSQPGITHDQLMDTYNEGPGLGLGGNCDDDLAFDGTSGINGFPHVCARAEGQHIGDMKEWFPIAAVNRFDLAPSDGANCGEARLVMANNSNRRMFVIFEAKIPNPNPECGINACEPVQQFWADLSDTDNAEKRGDQLFHAFIKGHPALEAAGFGPFISQENLTFGTGQVRTNNFDQSPWTLREFKIVPVTLGNPPLSKMLPQAAPRLVQVPVAANPYGEYWDDELVLPHQKPCIKGLVGTVEHLMSNNPNLMAVAVPTECLAAESPDQTNNIQRYAFQLSGNTPLENAINARIQMLDPGSSLTSADIANRAAFAGGCIGCHEQTNNIKLGDGVIAPSSLKFVHTHEVNTENCGDGTTCFQISDALKESFLPHRKKVMDQFLSSGPCCEENDFEAVLPDPIDALDPEQAIPVKALMEAEAEAKALQAPISVGGTPTARSH